MPKIWTGVNGATDVVMLGEWTSDGAVIHPGALAQTMTYNADNTLNYVEVVVPPQAGTSYQGGTYRKTYTWSANKNLQSTSLWVKQ